MQATAEGLKRERLGRLCIAAACSYGTSARVSMFVFPKDKGNSLITRHSNQRLLIASQCR